MLLLNKLIKLCSTYSYWIMSGSNVVVKWLKVKLMFRLGFFLSRKSLLTLLLAYNWDWMPRRQCCSCNILWALIMSTQINAYCLTLIWTKVFSRHISTLACYWRIVLNLNSFNWETSWWLIMFMSFDRTLWFNCGLVVALGKLSLSKLWFLPYLCTFGLHKFLQNLFYTFQIWIWLYRFSLTNWVLALCTLNLCVVSVYRFWL